MLVWLIRFDFFPDAKQICQPLSSTLIFPKEEVQKLVFDIIVKIIF